jgi:hypothetical protein
MLQSARHLRAVALIATLGSAAFIAACDDDDDDGTNPNTQETFAVTMNGANERPTAVTTNATGTATLSFTGSGPIAYTINVNGLSGAASAAHIHGPAGVTEAAGPIVTFTGLSTSTTGQLVTGSITTTGTATVSMDSLKTLLRNGKAYINVHTAANQNGEVRGQIIAN